MSLTDEGESMKLHYSIWSLFLIVCFGLILQVSAAEDSVFAEKAQTRKYVGGADEADLKVQAQVKKLKKSKNETSIEADEEEGF